MNEKNASKIKKRFILIFFVLVTTPLEPEDPIEPEPGVHRNQRNLVEPAPETHRHHVKMPAPPNTGTGTGTSTETLQIVNVLGIIRTLGHV